MWVLPALFLGIALGYPLVSVLHRSFADIQSIEFSPQLGIAASAALQALISMVGALLIGIPIAGVLATYRFRGRAFTQAIVTVPFVLPTVVIALAFRELLGTMLSSGLLLVVIAHIYINLAVVVRIVGATWQQLDQRMLIAARSLGASPFRAFITVTLPQLKASITSAASIVFVFCFTSLGVVLVLGNSSTRTLETQILRETSLLLDFPTAAITAMLQLIVVTIALVLGARASMNSTSKIRTIRFAKIPKPHGLRTRVYVTSIALVTIVLVTLPLISLINGSLHDSNGWTLQWWSSLTDLDAGTTRLGSPIMAIATSLKYALITGIIAGVIGVLAAMSVLSHRLGRAVLLIALAPLGISAATLGLGFMLSFGRAPFDLRGTDLLVPLAHSIVAVPLVIAVVLPTLRATDRRIAIAASALGARPTRAFFTAYGPVLRVVAIAAAGLAACVSLGEFGAASFLARSSSPTVPVQIVKLLQRPGEQSFGVACALAVILVIGTLALVAAIDSLGAKRWKKS
ncbi:MAG: ABC transporter permease subunit [Candidatus Nanopelagicales bacterium]|nr:ABC transporter permease subunit [Candidatus Nanopelagicales bacterium]